MNLTDDLPPPPDPPRGGSWQLRSKESPRGCREVLAVCEDIKTDPADQDGGRKSCCCGMGLRRMARDVGLHGVRRMSAGRKGAFTVRKVLWLVILLVSLASFTYQSVDCIFYYMTSPTLTNYLLSPQPSLDLPAMTICNANSFRLSQAFKRGYLPWLHNSSDRQIHKGGHNLTSRVVYSSTGHMLTDMLMGCWSEPAMCDVNSFTAVLTESGTCYTMNLTSYKTKLLFNPELYESFHHRGSSCGFKVLFHGTDEFPAAMENALLLAPGHHSDIHVYGQRVKLLAPPEGTCSVSARSLDECQAACKGRHILRTCGCQPFWMSVQENASICSMSQYVTCASRVRDVECYCESPCVQHHYDARLSITSLSHLAFSDLQANLTALQAQANLEHAYNIAARHTPQVFENDSSLIRKFINSFDDMVMAFETLRGNLLETASIVENTVEDLLPRINFHLHNALGGIKKSLEHGFIDPWDIMESRSLNPLASDFHDTIAFFDRALKKLQFTSSAETTMRNVIYFMMDTELSGKLEIAIEALDNLLEVYTAFRNAQAMGTYSVTPERRYDNALVPRDILSHSAESQREYYKEMSDNIAGYMTDILRLKTVLKDVYSSNTLNESARTQAKESFLDHSKQLNHYLSLFRNRVILKSREAIENKIEQFRRLNHSLIDCAAQIEEEITLRNKMHNSQYLTIHRNFVVLVEKAQDYINNPRVDKSDLVKIGLSQATKDTFADLNNIHSNLVARSQGFGEIFAKYHDTVDAIWRSFLLDHSVRNFSSKLYDDVTTMMNIASQASHLRDIFTHPKLLNINRDDARSITPARFYTLLNADITVLDQSSKLDGIRNRFVQLKRSTDVGTVVGNKVQEFERNFHELRDSLEEFSIRTVMDEDYIRDNFIEMHVRISEGRTSEILELPAYTTTSLLGDIGGLLALFLGASAITVFELLDMMCSNCNNCESDHIDEEKIPTVRKTSSYGAPVIHYSSVSQHPSDHYNHPNHIHLKRDSASTTPSPSDRYQSGNGLNQPGESPGRYSNKDLRQSHRVHFANTDI